MGHHGQVDVVVFVPLTQGMFAKVDMDDYWVLGNKWHFQNGYAHRRKDARTEGMHNAILKYYGPNDIDHKDNDGLNNRRDNLRILPHKINCLNVGAACIDSYVTARGVTMHQGYISVNYTKHHLGTARSRWVIEWLVAINRQRAMNGETLLAIKRKGNRWSPLRRVGIDPYG